MKIKQSAKSRRSRKVGGAVRKVQEKNIGLPAIVVSPSNNHMRVQATVYDPYTRATSVIAAASTLEAEVKQQCKSTGGVEAARLIGKLLAQRVLETKQSHLPKVIFNRNGHLYHGRVAALAEGAREGGLDF